MGIQMLETLLLVMKYASTFLALGVAFAGSWFFEFTTTDKESGRRTLTKWGTRAVIFASAALICSVVSTIGSDYQANRNQQAADRRVLDATNKAIAEQQAAQNFRLKSEGYFNDIKNMMDFIDKNFSSLSASAKADASRTISALSGVQAIKADHPEIYKRMQDAVTYPDVAQAVQEGVMARALSRISEGISCADANITKNDSEGFPVESEFISRSPPRNLSYMVHSDGILLSLNSETDYDFAGGYSVFLRNGTTPIHIACTQFRSKGLCQSDTKVPETRAAFIRLQRSPITKISYEGTEVVLPPEISNRLNKTLSCLTP